jgi:hypothetical protein
MSVTNLCALKPADPGPPTASDLEAMMALLPLGTSLDPAQPFPTWVLEQVQYHYFTLECECINPAEVIAPRAPVSIPPGTQPWPSDHASQPQITRIESNQSTSATGLDTLYLGVQAVHNQVSDLRFRQVQQILNYIGATQWTMQNEGYVDLQPDFAAPGTGVVDRFGILVHLSSIPSTVKRRGTLHPRLYGVGSLEWDAHTNGGPANYWTVQRDALHYATQFLHAPQSAQAVRLYWRLQPGVVAQGYEVPRSADAAIYPTLGAYDRAWSTFSDINPPAGWNDRPFYPKPAERRVFALGGAP